MLAKSSLVLFVLAVGLSLSLNGNPSVANAVPMRLSHTDDIDPDTYYETMYKNYSKPQDEKTYEIMYKEYSKPQDGKTHERETYQDQNTLQQSGSDVENHFESEVEMSRNIHEGSNSKVDESLGAKTFQTHNTYQQFNTKGKNFMGSRVSQHDNIYLHKA